MENAELSRGFIYLLSSTSTPINQSNHQIQTIEILQWQPYLASEIAMNTFENKALTCCDCKTSFVFSAEEQQFFAIKGLLNEPKRCLDCRIFTRMKREGKGPDSASRVICADCGVLSVVPFKPTGRKPVYCGECLRSRNSKTACPDQRQLVPAS